MAGTSEATEALLREYAELLMITAEPVPRREL